MKSANQILGSGLSKKQISVLIDKRLDAIAKALDDLYYDAENTAVLINELEFSTFDVREKLMPLLKKAEAAARKS